MAGFAKRMQGTAKKLIGKFDERETKVKLIRQGVRFFDPIRGANVFGANTELPVSCVQVNQDNKLFENSQIETGDILLVLTSDVEPLMADNVLSDGKTYSVVDIKPVSYTGSALTISYGVHARG